MARTDPGHDSFPQGGTPASAARAEAGRPLGQRGRPLPSLSPDDADGPAAPFAPGGRLSAPPPNLPPVFERPAQPRGDQRTWSAPSGSAQSGTVPATRSVPAFTAHQPTRPIDGLPVQGGSAGATWATATTEGSTARPAAAPGPTVVDRPPAPPPAGPPADLALGRPARRRPGRVAVATVLAALLTAGAGYGAVVAVPRYVERADRLVWERTSVHIPRTVAGMSRVTTASANVQAKSAQQTVLGTGAGQLISDLAVYSGKSGTRVVVVVGRPQHPLSADERDIVRSGYTRAVAASGVVLTERDPGDLGGWFGCGVHKGRTTMCLAVDAGAVVSVTVTATGGSALTLAREARAAVERRAAP